MGVGVGLLLGLRQGLGLRIGLGLGLRLRLERGLKLGHLIFCPFNKKGPKQAVIVNVQR